MPEMRYTLLRDFIMTPAPRKARSPPLAMTSRFNTRDFRGVGVVLAY